ncbi:cytochrome b5 domain-containing protein 1-like isoform X1 [Bolinopsis microptera]|uniref:cytochrome b5 domain-containing protein 1-like isoform X1 n=1 Tax=Bolinopsis microptera TaxID=2820187 RepID=UPI003078FCEC
MAPTYKQRYYTPLEVEQHSSSKDLWVSFLGKVYNLTPLVEKNGGNILLKPILNAGGKDISHWFNTNGTNCEPLPPPPFEKNGHSNSTVEISTSPSSQHSSPTNDNDKTEMTKLHQINNAESLECFAEIDKKSDFDPQIRTHIDGKTGCEVPYTPQGRFIHIPPPYPSASWANDFGTPWWKDESYCIGHLSTKTRKIRIINTLTSQEHTLEVCSEETLEEILNRFYKYNKHAASYTWKYNGTNLTMTKTLEQNGVKDEDEEFYELNFNEEDWLPAIHIYFNDDLTEA